MKMTRCLRICGAYSYRLSRRHSTCILIASFIITITIILHLYSNRHQRHLHPLPRVGDFDYRPGNFLRGKLPDNRSYCDFNYGLPETLKWGSFVLSPSPDGGNGNGTYVVIYNAIKGRAYNRNLTKYETVTYATQATPEFLFHIVEIARYWDGPISLSVFVPGYDLDVTIQIMEHLCSCYPGMAKVSMHLFYPRRFPPKIRIKSQRIITTTEAPAVTTVNVSIDELMRQKVENYRNLNSKTRAQYIELARKKKIARMMARLPKSNLDAPNLKFEDCSGPESFNMKTFRKDKRMLYPINVGRNAARFGSVTNYFIISDIEMVPSEGLAPKFAAMVRKLMGEKKRKEGYVFTKTVFVVPLFEVERGEAIPRDKETLVRLVNENRAMYFHQKSCTHCQRFPGLQSWLSRTPPKVVEPMLIARREYPFNRWEPLYFGTNKEPWYSETLSWEGKQEKMVQMLELCLQKYRLVVLDGGFLCHAAAPKNTNKTKAEEVNNQKYAKIVSSLKHKYPPRPQCKVDWGCNNS